MKQKITILFLFLLLPSLLHAQPGNEKRAYHWYFGRNAGLDFSSGIIQEDTLGMAYAEEGTSSISDTAGNLLFYASPDPYGGLPGSDNMSIYNANHEYMQNGTDIDAGWSGRQNSIIVPKPENNSIYYLFTIDDLSGSTGYQFGFKYSIIDMNLDGGLGAVTDKNIEIYQFSNNDTLSEVLTAVHHANCSDVWILIHRNNASKYQVYKLTENGLDNEPVITQTGYHDSENFTFGFGAKFSPNGKHLAVNKSYNWASFSDTFKNDTLELYKFNNSTGVLSDRITLPMDSALYGKEFSPECNYLYTFELYSNSIGLYQYDISKWQKPYILNSKTLVDINFTGPYPDLHITPLNNICIASMGLDSISVIEQPNNHAINCSLNTNVLGLSNEYKWNLPNFVRSYFNADTASYNCDTATYKKSFSSVNLSIYPNPVQDKAIINTNGKAIIQYSLCDITGKQLNEKSQYNLKKISKSKYMFNNLTLKGGIYFLNGRFSGKEQFQVKFIIH